MLVVFRANKFDFRFSLNFTENFIVKYYLIFGLSFLKSTGLNFRIFIVVLGVIRIFLFDQVCLPE